MNGNMRQRLVDAALDVCLLVSFLVATAPRLSGIPVHEWLSVALAVVVIWHLLRHWQWIVQVGKSFFQTVTVTAKLNYLLNVLFFVTFVLLMYSGIAISDAVMPSLGTRYFDNRAWRMYHHLFSNITLIIMAVHVAVNWQWIINLFRHRQKTATVGDAS